MNWTVYRRTNRLSGRCYVGVTSKTIEIAWAASVDNASRFTSIAERVERSKSQKTVEHAKKRLAAAEGTFSYDVWKHGSLEAWDCDIVFVSDNIVAAYARERAETTEDNTRGRAYKGTNFNNKAVSVGIDVVLDAIGSMTVADFAAIVVKNRG